MKKHTINNISNTRIEFTTKSKKRIVEVFNYKCKSLFTIKEENLELVDNKLCLQIDLTQWNDDYDDSPFLMVLESVKRISNNKGNLATVLKANLIGFDNDRNLSFVFTDKFVNGRHSMVGQYENGEKLLYTDSLYIL